MDVFFFVKFIIGVELEKCNLIKKIKVLYVGMFILNDWDVKFIRGLLIIWYMMDFFFILNMGCFVLYRIFVG